ncbi:hypothetical protein [Kordia sp.]|uniref:hypothetical protein n=1 Tax=Kordia sp. TaxID=1965332 RepID=UPI003D6AF248
MKVKSIFIILFILCSSRLLAQETSITEEKLVGEWNYIKAVDKKNKERKYMYRIFPNGYKMGFITSGPKIIINSNGTYLKKFPKETLKGNWKIISKNEIEYEEVVPIGSMSEEMITQIQRFSNKKWAKDENGNFLDPYTCKIILLTNTEMRVMDEEDCIFIYKKDM